MQSITCGAFTGTLDFSANNNNVTLSASGAFSGSGSGARTINLGSGTWTLNATIAGTIWDMGTVTNLTFNANSSTIRLTGNTASAGNRVFSGGGLTYSTLEVSAQTSGGTTQISGANTFGTLTISGQNFIQVAAAQTITTLNVNGTSSAQVALQSNLLTTQRALTVTNLSATWVSFRSISGSGTATNAFDLGNNSGFTITAPSAGSGRAVQVNNPSLVA